MARGFILQGSSPPPRFSTLKYNIVYPSSAAGGITHIDLANTGKHHPHGSGLW